MADGFLWPRTVEKSAREVSCNLASDLFRRETLAVRQCQDGGIWGAPDLTTCTLQENVEPFLLLWFVIENQNGNLLSPKSGFSADGIPDEQTTRDRGIMIMCEDCILWAFHINCRCVLC